MKSKKIISMLLACTMLAGLLAACGSQTATKTDPADSGPVIAENEDVDILGAGGGGEPDPVAAEITSLFDAGTAASIDADAEWLADEAVALSAKPAFPSGIIPVASGTSVATGPNCAIDYSNASSGYFMAKWTGDNIRIKVQSTGPSGVTYTYDLFGNDYDAFPFSDGNGSYLVRIMRNTTGSKYAVAVKTTIDVKMDDPFVPFLASNQYVNFEDAPNACKLAADLCSGKSGELDKVAAVYDWVVDNVTYDYNLAQTVSSTYLPTLDNTVSTGRGICFDYASLMSGMLRSQGVPCKLVIGYAGKAYHAWISVYVEGQGWVDGVIFFDGTTWQRMDPTYASTGNRSDTIMSYIGDGSHYSSKYMY